MMKKIFGILVAICALQVATSALAESQPKELTDAQVRKFSTAVIQSYKKPLKDYEALIKSSYTNDATYEFKTNITGVVKKEVLTKKDYEKKLKTYHAALQGGKVDYKILNVKIAADKKSAVLKDSINFQKEISMPSDTEKTLQINSTSICEKLVVLSTENQPQIKSTKCQSKAEQAKPKKNK